MAGAPFRRSQVWPVTCCMGSAPLPRRALPHPLDVNGKVDREVSPSLHPSERAAHSRGHEAGRVLLCAAGRDLPAGYPEAGRASRWQRAPGPTWAARPLPTSAALHTGVLARYGLR